jgi:hypothetical protein
MEGGLLLSFTAKIGCLEVGQAALAYTMTTFLGSDGPIGSKRDVFYVKRL